MTLTLLNCENSLQGEEPTTHLIAIFPRICNLFTSEQRIFTRYGDVFKVYLTK